MLPIEAIGNRLRDVLAAAFPEYDGRIHLHRTLPLDYDTGEVPGVLIAQGEDAPSDANSTMSHAAWIATFTVRYVIAGDSGEAELVKQLNDIRLRAHRAIMDNARINLDWLIEVAPGPAQEIATDATSANVIKELSTIWQALYLADRRNPDVSYPP